LITNPQKRQEARALVDALESDVAELSQKFSGQEIPEEAKSPIFLRIDRLRGILIRDQL